MPVNPDKVIISDTACLIGLTNIGRLDLLREMYGSILITPEVAAEYGSPLPEWIIVQAVSDTNTVFVFNQSIDLGEASSIALALETRNPLLILDDRRARQFALNFGLEITGTLGLIIRAYEKGIIQDIDSIIASLREVGFRLPDNSESIITDAKK
jgi:predicted nucleic acid-binding protein